MSLVEIDQVKEALRIDDDDADADIALKIAQAEDIVLDFVQPKPDPAWDAASVPARVTAAIILVVGYLYDDSPEAQEALAGLAGAANGKPSAATALLWRLRDPTLA